MMYKIAGAKRYTEILSDGSLYLIKEVGKGKKEFARIKFQQGRSRKVGINGVHSEDLLLILIDRMEKLQQGRFICNEHNEVISLLKKAIVLLRNRNKNEKEK